MGGKGQGSKKGRGRAVTRDEEVDFLFWLSSTGDVNRAAEYAGRTPTTWWKRRYRDPDFKRKWEIAAEGNKAAEKLFWVYLEELGIPVAAYTEAGLTQSWFFHRMRTNPAFKERVSQARVRAFTPLWRKANEMAMAGDTGMLKFLISCLGRPLVSGR